MFLLKFSCFAALSNEFLREGDRFILLWDVQLAAAFTKLWWSLCGKGY